MENVFPDISTRSSSILLLDRGHLEVKITTETDNEGANRQLKSWGFEQRGLFHFYGKEMVLYVLNLVNCERLSPFDWTVPQAVANSNLPNQTLYDRVNYGVTKRENVGNSHVVTLQNNFSIVVW